MKQHNNCDKSNMVKLFIIVRFLQQPNYYININKTSKRRSKNIKHKNNVTPNNLSIKKNNIECLEPKQEVIIDDTKHIPPLQDVIIDHDTKHIPPLQDIIIEDDIKLTPPLQDVITEDTKRITTPIIKKNIDIFIKSTLKLNNTDLGIKSMKDHISIVNSKVLPMY